MGRAEDIIHQVCSPGAEWERVPIKLEKVFTVCINLDRECKRQNTVALKAEVQGLIYENFSKRGLINYTDGSVIWHVCSSWACVVQVQEDCEGGLQCFCLDHEQSHYGDQGNGLVGILLILT